MGWLVSGLCTWTCRLFIFYQVYECYWAFDTVDKIPFAEDTRAKFQLVLHIWIWLSIIFGLLTFIGIKNFCEPGLDGPRRRDEIGENNGGLYYDFLDVGTRYAFLLSWMYYFIVVITWIHHGQFKVASHGGGNLIVFLGVITLILLTYVNEINIKVLQVILAIAHLIISIKVSNDWGVVVSLLQLLQAPFILTCTDQAPVTFNPTFIFTSLTVLSSLCMTYFFKAMQENTVVVVTLDSLFINR